LISSSKVTSLVAVFVTSLFTGSTVPVFSQSNITESADTNATSGKNLQYGFPFSMGDTDDDTGVTQIPSQFQFPPPVILSPETIPQLNETIIVLNPRPPEINATDVTPPFNTTTSDTNTSESVAARSLLIWFEKVAVNLDHDRGRGEWFLWAGVTVSGGVQQDPLWVPLLHDAAAVDGIPIIFEDHPNFPPKIIAIEVPSRFPPGQFAPIAIDLKVEGYDDDCHDAIIWFTDTCFDTSVPGPTPSRPSHSDWENLGEIRWFGWNFQNWGMDPGETLGAHTVRSVGPFGPFLSPWHDYELTFYVMDCGGPICTVIDYDGDVHRLDPPAVLY
jgi:hypothetical protein